MSSNILKTTIPTIPTIPKLPNITDFNDFSSAVTCIAVLEKHTALTLKLRSSHLGAEVILDSITPLIQEMLGKSSFRTTSGLINFNMDLAIAKISNPKIRTVPHCLTKILSGEPVSNKTNKTNKVNALISNVSSGSGVFDINDFLNSALNSFISDTKVTEAQVKEANNILNSSIALNLDPTDKILFNKLDKLSKYLIDTNYINDYKAWKKMTKCIQENCPILKDTILTDDFMWSDESRRNFIMPIDINNSKIRIHKFFRELTRAQIQKANEIEKRYYKYIRDKIEIAKSAADRLRSQNIEESKNPFVIVAESLSS